MSKVGVFKGIYKFFVVYVYFNNRYCCVLVGNGICFDIKGLIMIVRDIM